MEYVIPCETFVRLSNVLKFPPLEPDPIINSIRIENGIAIATNRRFMAIERINPTPAEPIHVILNEKLIAQCDNEKNYHSNLHIEAVKALSFGTAKTTLGYIHPENACLWSDGSHDLDGWKSIIKPDRPTVSNGSMYWQTEGLIALAKSSPSGCLYFEQYIDVNKATVIRDYSNPDWFGLFLPKDSDKGIEIATLPEWFKP